MGLAKVNKSSTDPPETTVAVVVLDVVVDVVVFVNAFVLALFIVTDHILFTCGQ